MQYRISPPVYIHEQGVRPYSEDYLYPEPGKATEKSRLFMVCDGVGGSVRGDQASREVCKHFAEYVLQNQSSLGEKANDVAAWEVFLNEALKYTEAQMDLFTQANPECRGMASTLTFLYLSPQGAVVAWAGDSRVYLVRDGEKVFRTSDHSLVYELYRRGEITEAEMATHPRKNVILRAVSGRGNPTKVDVALIQDLRPGDRFLMCSDGVVDGIPESDLLDLLATDRSLGEISDEIAQLCSQHSRDNYTHYLLQLEEVTGALQDSFYTQPTLPMVAAPEADAPYVHMDELRPPAGKAALGLDLKQLSLVLVGLLLVVLVAVIAVSKWKNDPLSPEPPIVPQDTVIHQKDTVPAPGSSGPRTPVDTTGNEPHN